MKKYYVLFLLLPTLASAQEIAFDKVDDFTGDRSLMTKDDKLSKSEYFQTSFGATIIKAKSDTVFYLSVFYIAPITQRITDKSKATILFDNGEQEEYRLGQSFKIIYADRLDFVTLMVPKGEVMELMKTINKIRISGDNIYHDLTVGEKYKSVIPDHVKFITTRVYK